MKPDMLFLRPYTFRRVKWAVMLWEIEFEGDGLMTVFGLDNAQQTVELLNGAYNLGRMHEMLSKELDNLAGAKSRGEIAL